MTLIKLPLSIKHRMLPSILFVITLLVAGSAVCAVEHEEAYATVPMYTVGTHAIPEPYSHGYMHLGVGKDNIVFNTPGYAIYNSSTRDEQFYCFDNKSRDSDIYVTYKGGAKQGSKSLDVKVYTWASGTDYRISLSQCSMWNYPSGSTSGVIYAEYHFIDPDTGNEVDWDGVFFANNINAFAQVRWMSTSKGRLADGYWVWPNSTLIQTSASQLTDGAGKWNYDASSKEVSAYVAIHSTPTDCYRMEFCHVNDETHGAGSAVYGCGYEIKYQVSSKSSKDAGNTISNSYVAEKGTYSVEYGTHGIDFLEGYKIDEWYSDDACTSLATKINMVSGDLVFYGIYKPINYNIVYNANGGEGSSYSDAFTYNVSGTIQSNKFTRERYNFLYWNTSIDGSGTSYSPEQIVQNLCSTDGGTVNLYAQWELITYPIYYDLNGGFSSQIYENPDDNNKQGYFAEDAPGTTCITSYKPYMSDHTFLGWAEERQDVIRASSSDHEALLSDARSALLDKEQWVMPARDVTLYAVWVENPSVTVTVINGRGGKVVAYDCNEGETSELGTVTSSEVIKYEFDQGDESFSFAPDWGFEVADVAVDGVSIDTPSEYNFGHVLKNHTVDVTFSRIMCTVEVTKSLEASDLYEGHGDTSFIFTLTNTADNSTYYETISFDPSLAENNETLTNCCTFEVPLGTYTLNEVSTTRWEGELIEAVGNADDARDDAQTAIVSTNNNTATFAFTSNSRHASALYKNSKTNWSGLSHSSTVINHFGK